MFQMPQYIEKIKVTDHEVDFEWVEGDETDYYNRDSQQLTTKIMELSPRARLALAIGIAEWIVWRVNGFSKYQDVTDFVESSWAGVIDPRYTLEWTRQGKEFLGPVLGPQRIVARHLDKAMLKTWDRQTTIRNCQYLAFLCHHVWKRRKALKDWLLFAFDRLADLYPISPVTQDYYGTRGKTGDEPFDFGDVVPREVLDPDFNFDPQAVPKLLDAYLRGLNPDTNRFLRTPQQMVELGFEGTPYRYPAQAPVTTRED
jgi:hypothetical protein